MAEKWIPKITKVKAIGPYNLACGTAKHNGILFLSGQIPMDPNTGELVTGGIEAQTTQVLKNIEAILTELGLTFKDVVKTTVFLTAMEHFEGFNDVYATAFGELSPARSTVGVEALPKGSLVEIECVVAT